MADTAFLDNVYKTKDRITKYLVKQLEPKEGNDKFFQGASDTAAGLFSDNPAQSIQQANMKREQQNLANSMDLLNMTNQIAQQGDADAKAVLEAATMFDNPQMILESLHNDPESVTAGNALQKALQYAQKNKIGLASKRSPEALLYAEERQGLVPKGTLEQKMRRQSLTVLQPGAVAVDRTGQVVAQGAPKPVRSGGESTEQKTLGKELGKYNAAVDNAAEAAIGMEESLADLENAYKNTNRKGVVASVLPMAAGSAEAQRFDQIATKMQFGESLFKGQGAVSNYERQLAQKATFNRAMEPEAFEEALAAAKELATIAKQKQAMKEQYYAEKGTLQGFSQYFNQYIDSNKNIDSTPDNTKAPPVDTQDGAAKPRRIRYNEKTGGIEVMQ